ncbi:MAG TPA: laccase domain-containing protein, partial [Thermomonas sp.]|nr:laccase domain-containing protein [Thermomonas sp.]
VHGGDLCTLSDPARFFSHRRSTLDGSGGSGRIATLAWIVPSA